jgi:hypothetical protein
MYPIAFAAVKAERKDNWSWFLETLVSNFEAHERHARSTIISDWQKAKGDCKCRIHG